MSPALTIDELEGEVLDFREQNQKILRELSTVIDENAALRERLCIKRDAPMHGCEESGRVRFQNPFFCAVPRGAWGFLREGTVVEGKEDDL
jgi:hypothetical protein